MNQMVKDIFVDIYIKKGGEKWSNDHNKSNNFKNNNDDEANMTTKHQQHS